MRRWIERISASVQVKIRSARTSKWFNSSKYKIMSQTIHVLFFTDTSEDVNQNQKFTISLLFIASVCSNCYVNFTANLYSTTLLLCFFDSFIPFNIYRCWRWILHVRFSKNEWSLGGLKSVTVKYLTAYAHVYLIYALKVNDGSLVLGHQFSYI